MIEILIQSVSISLSDDACDSEELELESSVDISSSELESKSTDFNISSVQIMFQFFNFFISEISNNYY